MDKEQLIKEEFRNYCNTDNFSAPPYECDTISNFWLDKIQEILESKASEIEGLIVNTPEEVAELNKDVPSPINEHAYYESIGFCEAVKKSTDIIRNNHIQ